VSCTSARAVKTIAPTRFRRRSVTNSAVRRETETAVSNRYFLVSIIFNACSLAALPKVTYALSMCFNSRRCVMGLADSALPYGSQQN
jgi:hypothetical protein